MAIARSYARQALPESSFTTTRELRDLAHLNRSAASCRVLNLAQIYVNYKDNEDYGANPLFENSALNRAIILKHTLRMDERHLFRSSNQTVTKIILPYDPYDLHLGGRAFFFRQTHFETLMKAYLSIDNIAKSRDVDILRCLDRLPSLDPFLLREHLHRMGVKPAGVYFRISPADLQSMSAFTTAQIGNLVSAAIGDTSGKGAAKLGHRILSDQLDKELWPLQQTLGMSDEQFSDGITCWRGFLYYKWCYIELQDGIRQVLSGLSTYKPVATHDESLRTYLKRSRQRLAKALVKAIQETGHTLEAYDEVYQAMARDRDPEPFRQFLMHGSKLFLRLGDKIGILNHIVSFWRFRMKKVLENNSRPLESIEFADILIDFESGLANALHDL